MIDGQGLPLIKPPALRRMAGYEKTRVLVLRQLESQLGVRRPDELKLATGSQILTVVSEYNTHQMHAIICANQIQVIISYNVYPSDASYNVCFMHVSRVCIIIFHLIDTVCDTYMYMYIYVYMYVYLLLPYTGRVIFCFLGGVFSLYLSLYLHTHAHTHTHTQGVSKAVYKGLLELLKYFLHSVEDELQKEPEASIFSVFLLLRLAFSVFVLPKNKGTSSEKSPSQKPMIDHALALPLPVSMAISPTSIHVGETVAVSNSPSRCVCVSVWEGGKEGGGGWREGRGRGEEGGGRGEGGGREEGRGEGKKGRGREGRRKGERREREREAGRL